MVSSLVRPGVHLPALCGVARGEGGEGDERDGHDQAWRISLPCSCKYPVVLNPVCWQGLGGATVRSGSLRNTGPEWVQVLATKHEWSRGD